MTETRFLGPDPPSYPTIEDARRVGEELAAAGYTRGILSVRAGDRCITSPPGISLEHLPAERFVEVVDYDPYRDQLLVLGPSAPDPLAALHWLVLRGRREANAILQIEADPASGLLERVPRAERGRTLVETALSVLEHLKEGPVVALSGRWVLAVGPSCRDARDELPAVSGAGDSQA